MFMLRSLIQFSLFLFFISGTTVSAETLIKVGVAPSDGAGSVALAKRWVPFLNQLEASSGLTFRFATAPDLLAFHQRMSNNAYDMVVTDSYLYTIFKQKQPLHFMAELGPQAEGSDLVLVCHPDISMVEQLDGTLLAVRRGEANSNLQLLESFLNDNSVTVRREGLSSDEKVLHPVEEKVHLAGLVPLELVKQQGESLNILWQTPSQERYLLSAHHLLNDAAHTRLMKALEQLMLASQAGSQDDIAVLSVRKEQE